MPQWSVGVSSLLPVIGSFGTADLMAFSDFPVGEPDFNLLVSGRRCVFLCVGLLGSQFDDGRVRKCGSVIQLIWIFAGCSVLRDYNFWEQLGLADRFQQQGL